MVDLTLSSTVVQSPVGELLLVASQRGLLKIAFASADFTTVKASVEAKLKARMGYEPALTELAVRQLKEYFAGPRPSFELPLDHSLSTGFASQVHEAIGAIPVGQTATYKSLAEAVKSPKAVRAVGTACGSNPIPIVVPCHRVLRSDGSLGGYAGGLETKKQLLKLEHLPWK